METKSLVSLCHKLEILDQEKTIYAAHPWTENSIATILSEPETKGIPKEAAELGLEYFIEVSVAQEFLKDWEEKLDEPPTIHEKCKRMIQYATNDA